MTSSILGGIDTGHVCRQSLIVISYLVPRRLEEPDPFPLVGGSGLSEGSLGRVLKTGNTNGPWERHTAESLMVNLGLFAR